MQLQAFLEQLVNQDNEINVEAITETTSQEFTSVFEMLESIMVAQREYPLPSDALTRIKDDQLISGFLRSNPKMTPESFISQLTDQVTGLESLVDELVDDLADHQTLLPDNIPADVGVKLFVLISAINALDLLPAYLDHYTALLSGQSSGMPVPMYRKLVDGNFAVITILNLSGKGKDELLKHLDSIPDLQLNASTVMNLYKANRRLVEGGKVGLISLSYNPFFIARILLAQRKVNKLKRLQHDRELITARIRMYEDRQNGQHNPSNEKAITYYRGLVDKIDRDIERLNRG